ncbi:MAG: regulatory signaling modulator protein AmpE [Gammaproteobacteria bacterium]|nr:regulatory signaling modulator protein AmpE [Gammaproteobacteria bacterium]
MTFLSVLIALLIERVFNQYRPARRHGWFSTYCGGMSRVGAVQWLMTRPWGAALALLPPLLLIGWLQWLAASLGSLAGLVFGTLVLVYCLGPRELGEEAEGFIDARDRGDRHRAQAAAQDLCLVEAPDTEPRRSFAVARAVVVLANRRLIGPLFWFLLFGPVGAAAYRAIHLMAEHLQAMDCPHEMKRYSDELRHIADWAPARITATGYAVAGNFDAVAHSWRTFDYVPSDGPLAEAEHLLAQTGLAALDTFPHEAHDLYGDDPGDVPPYPALTPPVVEDALALVWRTLTLWVGVIGGGTLIAWIA